ncbi:hypothetical protein DSL72_001210 [Monilinia vaccinii-corymbosi]|uniref:Uncharacterized protein n=1 Tax=Monilinia vaccinii-corymbosi TaxID=61207 RepID=A0A8A3P1E1_9HELO|nr:hypothetical protein DSL72_001210 [Monilinia vaccinii-corymbosi]
MPALEQEARNERRISTLVWKAINSQLELEKASEKLMKDVYGSLERMKAAGSPRHEWMKMYDFAQQLVNTLKMLQDDGVLESMIKEESADTGDEIKIKVEEDIEGQIEVLLREMHPNLDQILAGAEDDFKKEEFQNSVELAKHMALPRQFSGEKENKAVEELGSTNVKGVEKKKKQYDNSKIKEEKNSDHAPKRRRNRKPSPRISYNDFEEDGASVY